MKGYPITYSADELAWLEENRAMVISDYQAAFSARFGRDVSAANLHALRKRKGWKTGRTGCFAKGAEPHNKGRAHPIAALHPNCRKTHFKKGHEPHNTRFAGHERINKNGYIEVSVEQTNPHTGYRRRYVLKHRWLWEMANGPVPDGMALKCLGDKLNTDPSNWQLVPRAILPRLNGGRHKTRVAYDSAPDELKPTILAVAKLAHRSRSMRAGS